MAVITRHKKRDGSTMPKTVARDAAQAKIYIKIRDLYEQTDADGGRRYRQVELAQRFGISQGRVSQIVNNPNAEFYYE